jgi:ABC-2 type transport system ATP-binding protein
VIRVDNLVKSYAKVRAVDGVSFSVDRGEVFGLLGPNGAGKTTTIRALMDIIKPDGGAIELMGRPVTEVSKGLIGYLPEERGLYRNFKLAECLTYLATLKGMDGRQARNRALSLLEQVALSDYAQRKVKELSKGMTQKAQFLAAIVHDPDLLILDEPFQGLDPLNTDLVKSILLREQARGKTVILSTHNMNQVEEMCDRILLINEGRAVLYGELNEIQTRYAEHAVVLECDRLPADLDGVLRVDQSNHAHQLILQPDTPPQEILRQLIARDVQVQHFEVATPPLEEIFITVVEGDR